MKKDKIVEEIFKRKVVAVIRLQDPSKLIKVIEAIAIGGVSIIEITMTVPNAINLIKQVTKELNGDIIVGVGSVLKADTALQAIDAGAEYIVSPIFNKEIIEAAHRNDVPAMPGCFTPTEIFNAYESGADIIKVFPADTLGKEFFKSILAPMPFLNLMPTGGVTLTNADVWLKAGARAVGVGSALIDKDAISNNNFIKLTENARIISESVKNI